MKAQNRKAVILCGGKGIRLRPLTSNTPKPILKVGGIPVIINIINMLKNQNITDIALTTGYKGDALESVVKKHFKSDPMLNLKFYREQTPLGSAGSVKQAEDFLEGDFMVICGDAWCDFDVNSAFSLLENKNCHAVIVTSKTSSPLEYGLVISDENGKITAFTEKPAWSGVCSKTVNTGIYVFKKEILTLIPDGKYDFGRDLFSAMLRDKMEIYAHPINGRWCDIGDPEAYYRCNMEATDKMGYIGKNCHISPQAVIEQSVILDNVTVSKGAIIKGAVIGDGCLIEENCKIKQGCVIGPNSIIKEGALLHPGVFLNENTVLDKNSHVANPLHGINLFMNRCMHFDIDIMTDSFCRALGQAIRIAMGNDSKIGVMTDKSGLCNKISQSLTEGISSDGQTVYYLGIGSEEIGAFAARKKKLDLTVFVGETSDNRGSAAIKLSFFDENGVYPGAVFESNLKYAAKWSSTLSRKAGKIITFDGWDEVYINSIINECDAPIANMEIFFKGKSQLYSYIESISKKYVSENGKKTHSITVCADTMGNIDGVIYDGVHFDKDHILCTVILYYISRGVTEIPLPHRTPDAIKKFVTENGARLSLYSLSCHQLHENAVKTCFSHLPALQDPCFALFSFISYVMANNLTGKGLESLLPKFASITEETYIPESLKQEIIDSQRHSGEGFFIKSQSKIRLIPENSHIIAMCTEAARLEDARVLMKKAKSYVEKFIDENYRNKV